VNRDPFDLRRRERWEQLIGMAEQRRWNGGRAILVHQ
jgi:hypothetical protein